MLRRTILGIVLAAAAVGDAHADWQWTKWGGRPDEVAAASSPKGAVLKLSRKSDGLSEYSMPYSAQGFDFTAALTFGDQRGLISVTLFLVDLSDCYRLRNFLRNSVYGIPEFERKSESGEMINWTDLENGNSISFSENHTEKLGVFICTVRYGEVPRPGKSGL